jgi:hypothetical protein
LWAAALGQTGAERIRVDRLRADIAFLASAPLEGRKSLERGSEVTIQFVAAEFAKAGLKPAAGDSYLQEVPLLEYRLKPDGRRLAVRVDGRARQFEQGKDFSGAFPQAVKVSGAVVFAGYGITAPEFGYDDYAGLDAQNKIVLIFDHEPQETDPQSVFHGLGNTPHASPYLKGLNAQRHGAVGVLTVAEPNRQHPSNLERMARIPGGRERAVSPAAQALAEGERRIPFFTVSDALAAELLAGTGKKPGEIQAAIDAALKPASRALPGVSAEMEIEVAESRRAATANVIGVLEGSHPKLREETVLYTAHYDHLGVRGGQVLPGADDNASGTAGLIELARVFAQDRRRPKRTLVFVAFGAEETGLLGSYYYVAHALRPLAKTRAVLNLDMIGRDEQPSAQTKGLIDIAADTSNELNLIGLKSSPGLRAALERANRQVGLRLNHQWDDDTALNVLFRCDHFPFLLKNVPAVWLFNGFQPDYHQPTDTLEKLNFAKMHKIVRLAYLAGRALAQGE